jgi:hypothetical protein
MPNRPNAGFGFAGRQSCTVNKIEKKFTMRAIVFDIGLTRYPLDNELVTPKNQKIDGLVNFLKK